jgi:hypothetical protein
MSWKWTRTLASSAGSTSSTRKLTSERSFTTWLESTKQNVAVAELGEALEPDLLDRTPLGHVAAVGNGVELEARLGIDDGHQCRMALGGARGAGRGCDEGRVPGPHLDDARRSPGRAFFGCHVLLT